jgi:hypothetical protein
MEDYNHPLVTACVFIVTDFPNVIEDSGDLLGICLELGKRAISAFGL